MKPNALTTLVPILPEKLPSLRSYLGEIGKDIKRNPHVRFSKTPSTHFARWVILDRPSDPKPRLYFSACYDGELDAYMRELTSTLGKGMEPIWLCCQGYVPGAASDPLAFSKFLQPYSHQPDIFLIAFPDLTARQILANIETRELVDESLDAIQGKVHAQTPSAASNAPAAPPSPAQKLLEDCLSKLMTVVVDWLVGVQPAAVAPNTTLVTNPELINVEDVVVQNQMTVISQVKQSPWQRLLLRLFLYLGRTFNKPSATGQFSGLSTIHFARWVLIDNGNNLLFESNYDGSWESYIDDFGDFASAGMNAVWGSSVGFPKGGCLDIEAFKQGIRDSQYPAQVFYSAYPDETVTNIATDLALCNVNVPAQPFIRGLYE